MKKTKSTTETCPCGGGKYAACCESFHQGEPAPTAERLMRSRYSAFVLKLEPYLLATWHASTRPATLSLENDNTQWLGLTIKQHQDDGPDQATVEFVARYKSNGRACKLHETSRFVRENGRWFYVDGIFQQE
jgi:SEC-C motif-containing protein